MFHTNKAGKSFINEEEYREKVLGCWVGKNIGGTLGAPMEGKRDIFDVSFYTQSLQGEPIPNDDLDLQLVWLKAIEEKGLYNVNEQVLCEYWLAYVIGPWNEYGVAKFNMKNGLLPPLSGAVNNDQWKNSNGAWIRSEIWACMFPGEPDEVAPFAWYDACVDHTNEGIYAEIFIATMEAAAFIENNPRKLIDVGLIRIPKDCRVTRSIKLVIECFEHGDDWKTARNKIVEDSSDLGWFQAPANVAFVIIGLLYGKGDFSQTLCLAVNCGDDTDCTAATVGSILGIINGRSGIPVKWIEPIGDKITTVAVNPFHLGLPKTLTELTDRVIACKRQTDMSNPTLVRLTNSKTCVEDKIFEKLYDGEETAKRVLSKSSMAISYATAFGRFTVEFEKSPVVFAGETQKLTLSFENSYTDSSFVILDWILPDGWNIKQGQEQILMNRRGYTSTITVDLVVGGFKAESIEHIPIKIRLSERNYPVFVTIPFQLSGTIQNGNLEARLSQNYWDPRNMMLARIDNDLNQ